MIEIYVPQLLPQEQPKVKEEILSKATIGLQLSEMLLQVETRKQLRDRAPIEIHRPLAKQHNVLIICQIENQTIQILVYPIQSNNKEVPLKEVVQKERANNQAHELNLKEETDKHINFLVG